VFAEVTANGTKKVTAVPNSAGTAFYPTFKLDLFDIPGISVPYNGTVIIERIDADKTTTISIPRLTSVETNSAYIKLTNNSNSSLTLRQGNTEKSPLGGGSTVISAGQRAAYEITPGPVSGYSVMHNTTTPVAFPSGLTEFKADCIYEFIYDGTRLLSSIPPATPENVSIEVVSNANMRISWNEVTDAVSYRIYRTTGSSTASYTRIGTSTVTFYNDTSITTGQAYFYKVSALDSTNKESVQSTAVSIITPPANVRVTTVTTVSVSLAWNAYTGASGFNVYRSSAEAGTYSKINATNVSGTTFTDTGLLPDTTYYYKINAIIDDVEGLQSGSISASTLTSVPANVRISSVTTVSVSLAWNAVSEASGYNVYRSSTEAGTYSKINVTTISGTTFTDTGLLSDTTYYYKIRAIINNTEGLQSGSISASTLTSVPANVRVSTVTTISVSLSWNAVSEASGYNVYRSNSEGVTYTKINSGAINGTTFTDTDVTAYTAYWYKVSSITGGVESMQSSPVSVSTGTIVPGSGLAAKLAWLQSNAVSNSSYSIELNVDEYIVPQTLSYSGKSGITITLSGSGTMRTVNLSALGRLFTIGSSVTLILDNNITLKGRSDNNAPLVYINGGTLVMNTGAKITGNTNSSSSSSSLSNVGGVYINGYSTFTMNAGEISGNTGYDSGGVLSDGIFTMNGGKISGNTDGGVGNFGTFTMNAGEISGNNATYGGGVYVDFGTFTMNGGKITGNTATDDGGGVYVSDGTFIMKDGEISGNTAANNGGGVSIYDSSSYYGTFRISGGVIYGNNAAAGLKNTAKNGAALYKYSYATAQYGTFSGDTFYKSGDLTTTSTTIRIVNGAIY
jgi:fibronectin type 3 domain-containing protein